MPDNVRELRGNPGKRKPRPSVRQRTVVAVPPPPSWLSREAAAEWRRVTPELVRLRLVAMIDRAVLTVYCDTWSRWTQVRRSLDKADDGKPEPLTDSARWRLYARLTSKLAALASELGLTPNARARMTPTDAPKAKLSGDLGDLD